MKMHDVGVGPLRVCQITGSNDLIEVIDLGHQPPCGAVLTKEQLEQPEAAYPLKLMLCPESGLAQLSYVVDPHYIYPDDYCYRAGISWTVVEAHRLMAFDLVAKFKPRFCIDIGCNDGTLLNQLRKAGCAKVVGVEPTNVGQLATSQHMIKVHQDPFSQMLAGLIRHEDGAADLITMTNVFAHMDNLGEVMRGVKVLLAKDGVLVVENQYLLDVLEQAQFDTIYHEHIRTYSLKALVMLFAMYDMQVFHVERVPRYAGDIRVYVGNIGKYPVEENVNELLQIEESAGLFDQDTWFHWRVRVQRNRALFMEWLYSMQRYGMSIAGCSAPGRASTLLNYYGVTPELIRYTGELHDSLKLNKYIPGCHIPIVSNKRLIEEQPDYVVLLAWHYRHEIASRLRREGVRSKLVAPLPVHHIVEARADTLVQTC